MGKKILVTSTLLFFLPLVCLKGVEFQKSKNKHAKEKEVQFDYDTFKEDILNYGQANMETENGITEYTCADTLSNYEQFDGVESTYQNYLENTELHIDVKSYDGAGLVELNFEMIDVNTGESKNKGMFNGFIVETENGYKDVEIEILDKTFTATDLMNGNFDLSDLQFDQETMDALVKLYGPKELEQNRYGVRVILMDDGWGGGGGGTSETLGTLATIALTVANNDAALAVAENHVIAPAFNPFDLAPFLFHHYVIEHAKDHYEHNIQQEGYGIPKNSQGYIVNQNSYRFADFQYGLLDSTIQNSGCGIIAAYNAMHEANPSASINFSALIMTYELCYADFGFGYLGVLPYSITAEQKVLLAAGLTAIYELIVRPLLNFVISAIILPILLLVVSPIIAGPIVGVLYALVNNVGQCVIDILDFYILNLHSEGDMLRMFFNPNHVAEYTTYVAFQTAMQHRRQGIICFWNKYGTNGPEISHGAHYVYFNKYYDSSSGKYIYKTFNASQDGRTDITNSNMAKVMANSSNTYTSSQMMVGWALGAY